jgi:hypothetical protein
VNEAWERGTKENAQILSEKSFLRSQAEVTEVEEKGKKGMLASFPCSCDSHQNMPSWCPHPLALSPSPTVVAPGNKRVGHSDCYHC